MYVIQVCHFQILGDGLAKVVQPKATRTNGGEDRRVVDDHSGNIEVSGAYEHHRKISRQLICVETYP